MIERALEAAAMREASEEGGLMLDRVTLMAALGALATPAPEPNYGNVIDPWLGNVIA